MSAMHTPGPLTAHLDETYRVIDADGGSVALMTHLKGRHGMGGRRNSDEVAATCRLFAAAPDLLKACRLAIVALKGREHDGFLRDAIAKATGVRA